MDEFKPNMTGTLTPIEVARNTLEAARAVGDTELAAEMVGFLTAEAIAQDVRRTPFVIDHHEAQRRVNKIADAVLRQSTRQ